MLLVFLYGGSELSDGFLLSLEKQKIASVSLFLMSFLLSIALSLVLKSSSILDTWQSFSLFPSIQPT